MKKIKISQVAKINSDSIKGNIEDTILYLDTSSVTKGIFSEPQILNSKNDKIPSRAKRKVRENTILISTVRPNLCHFGIIKKPKKNLIVSTGFVTIDASPELIDANYLYYLLTSNDTIKYLDKIASTSVSAYPSFTPNDIKNYEISIIENINFQKKIGNLLYKIEEKIELNNKINSELEVMAKIIYDYWFLQFEFPNEEGKPYKSSGGKMVWNDEVKREIPEGWEVRKLEDYCNIFTGRKDVNQALEKGKYKFYSCSPNYKFSNDKLYEGKAILIAGNGSYTGRTIFVNEAIDLYQRTYACVSKNTLEYMEYLYYTLLKFFVPIVSGGTHGSAIPYIVLNDIAKQKILINKSIVEKFQDILVPIQNKIFKLKLENEELTSLRDFLLPLLMNGQVGFKE